MKFSNTLLLGNILSVLSTLSKADQCTFSGGNYYCSETDAIIYSNVGTSSSYQDVTSMDENTCACSSSAKTFSGNLAPLNEELSVHFRGPINLVQFGVYFPAKGSNSVSNLKKRQLEKIAEEECKTTAQKPKHQHKRDVAVQVVEVTATVFVNADGQSITPVGDINVDGVLTTSVNANIQNGAATTTTLQNIVSSYTQVSTILNTNTKATAAAAASSAAASSSSSSSSSSASSSASSIPDTSSSDSSLLSSEFSESV